MSIFRRSITAGSFGQRMAIESISTLMRRYGKKRVSLEDGDNGEVNKEVEYTIYARLSDFTQLEKALSVEEQEQWELKIEKSEGNAGRGGIRVRRTQVKGGDAVYTITTKVKAEATEKGASQAIEITIPTNEDNFTQFKFLSDRGMLKHRYRYPVVGTELIWEIDVFPNGTGGYHEWVKIDLEITDATAEIPELPIKFEEVILPKGYGDVQEAEWEQKVSTIYDNCFLSKNVFLKKLEELPTKAPAEVPAAPQPETPNVEQPPEMTEEAKQEQDAQKPAEAESPQPEQEEATQ